MKKTKKYVHSWTIKKAAPRLGKTPVALRADLRRKRRVEDGRIVADLDEGITAYKHGRVWRIVFPDVVDVAVGEPIS